MSVIKQITVFFLIISFSNSVFSQNANNNGSIPFLVDLKDPLIAYYSVTKDTSSLSISFYINGYESKQKREKKIKEYKDKRNKNRYEPIRFPLFSINFTSFTKPEKMVRIDGNYNTLNEFSLNKPILYPTYILIKQKDGTYLKWKTVMTDME